jgi:hypothetical protein
MLPLCVLATPPQAPLAVVAPAAGAEPIVVFDWGKERCEEWDVPDAPLRAFRDAQGGITADASNSNNRIFSGSSLSDIHHSCHSALTSHEDPDPGAYSGLRFITALWTDDGVVVNALIHNEYHADHFPKACLFKSSMKCWYTTIIGATSTDGGQTFKTATPPVVVAAAPFRQDFQQGRHRGFFNPTNIIHHGGFYYMATDTTGGAGQKAGLCLFRTSTVADPTSWRGYDGSAFTSRAIDPYSSDTNGYVPCEPVHGPGTAGSISWSSTRKLFMMVSQWVDKAHADGEIAYSWSSDLIDWSPPQTLLAEPAMSSQNCSNRFRYGYPSVLDPASPGRNFDEIGAHPVLFLTRFRVGADCGLPPSRDLIRLQLQIN